MLKRALALLVLCVFPFGFSCGGGGSSDATPSASPSVIAVSKSTGQFGGLMLNDQNEALMPIVSRNVSDTVTGIIGAAITDTSGSTTVVYLGDNGLPAQVVRGDYIFTFSNWDTTAQTVDIAVIYGPTSFIQAFKGVSVSTRGLGTDLTAPLKSASKATCFPACDSDTANLAQLIKLAALGISVGTCGIATVTSLGAMALPCASVIVTTASLVIGDETWLNNLEKASAYFAADSLFHCVTGPADCVAAVLEVGGSLVAGTDKTINDNSDHVTTADTFVNDPATTNGEIEAGGSNPTGCVLSSAYECTEGAFLPCFTGGTKTCGSDCKWGSCPASGSGTVATFDGTYGGSYSGSCATSQGNAPVSGNVTLVVTNGSIAVSSGGGSGSGTVNAQGGSSFGAGGGGDVTYSFTGNFSVSGNNGSAVGSWGATGSDAVCNGTWNANR